MQLREPHELQQSPCAHEYSHRTLHSSMIVFHDRSHMRSTCRAPAGAEQLPPSHIAQLGGVAVPVSTVSIWTWTDSSPVGHSPVSQCPSACACSW
jgi:hypothetical protein